MLIVNEFTEKLTENEKRLYDGLLRMIVHPGQVLHLYPMTMRLREDPEVGLDNQAVSAGMYNALDAMVAEGLLKKIPLFYDAQDEVHFLSEEDYAEYLESGELYHPESGEVMKNTQVLFQWEVVER